MFGFFKQKIGPAAQIDDYLKKLATEKFSDSAFKAAVKAELESFAQSNDVTNLEVALLGIHVGGATLPQLASALEHADVMILTRSHEKPSDCLYVLDPRDQTQRIALFTSDKRAARAIQMHPEFRCLMTYPARTLILNIADGGGIVVNPFDPIVTCNFNPKQLAAFKSDISKRHPPVPPPASVSAANLPPLPTAASVSANDLDGLINRFRAGALAPESFFPVFLDSLVFMLVKDPQHPEVPLSLTHQDRAPRLALFTSLERAKPIQVKHPGYRYAVKVKCGPLLVGVPPGSGLVLNPGSEDASFQMSAEQFDRFKTDFVPKQP